MPAVLNDPANPTIYRRSGPAPYPDPSLPPSIPEDIVPRQVTLRDLQTMATIVPFATHHQLPPSLLAYLCDQFNKEIEGGDAYPMLDLFTDEGFARYWFQNFGAVMLLGDIDGPESVVEGKDWSRECLGSFNIRPNYPGRSSHVCNAMFLVTNASRGRGVGRLMGEAYIDWAPRLGYTYSVFNLVYETNVASCRIWDALGFKRIGRVKGCGNLKSYPDRLIDALIYGRDLAPGDSEELVSEERFDKIKYYLKYSKYPNGADRAEKSRLRSAATHYKLLGDDKLMLKDKEVISDPGRQYDIARAVHEQLHGGINKTTATIAEKYHWSRIKETVSDVIKNCAECKDQGKPPSVGVVKKATGGASAITMTMNNAYINDNDDNDNINSNNTLSTVSMTAGLNDPLVGGGSATGGDPMVQSGGVVMDTQTGVLGLQDHAYAMMPTLSQPSSTSSQGYADPSDLSSITPAQILQNSGAGGDHLNHLNPHHQHQHQHLQHHHDDHNLHHHAHHNFNPHEGLMDEHQHQQHQHQQHQQQHQPHLHHHNLHHHDQYQPIDPQIISHPNFDHYHTHDFQALLNATGDDDNMVHQVESDSVDRDLEMLIDPHDDDMSDRLHDHTDSMVSGMVGKTGIGDEHVSMPGMGMGGGGGSGGKGVDDDDGSRMVYDVGFGSGR